MTSTHLTRTFAGMGIIIFGIAVLLGNIGLFNFGAILQVWWPMLLIAAGILVVLSNNKQYLTALIIISLGVLLQLNSFEIIDFDVWQLFWPAIIIAVGISVMVQRTATIKSDAVDNLSAFLAGVETKNESKTYQGSGITAILGGVSLDLRKAEIKKEATIDIFTLMGGVELRVPEHWIVRSQVTPIMGGLENKTLSHDKKDAPVLNIVGTLVMGGVEIKH